MLLPVGGDYNVFNNSFVGGSPISGLRSDTAHSGKYSARIETVVYTPASYAYIKPWGNKYFGHSSDTMGVLFTGNMDIVTTSPGASTFTGGIPYSHKAIQFRFWYQYTPNGNDEAQCLIFLSKWNGTAASTVSVGTWSTTSATGTAGWRLATIPMNVLDTLTPDTATILFSASSLTVLKRSMRKTGVLNSLCGPATIH